MREKRLFKEKDRILAELLLRRAADKIREKKEIYICFALDDSANTLSERRISIRLQEVIIKRLSPHSYLNSWLRYQGVPSAELNTERVREHRLRWIAELIKEFC